MAANEPMTDERLAWIDEWVGKVAPQQAYYGTMRIFMRELLNEVKRWRGLADRSIEDLSADDEWDENRQLREMLAAAREHAQTAHDQTAELGGYVVQLRAELAEAREAHQLSEAQLVEVTLERAEWRKQAQTHETVAKILRADLVAANQRAERASAAERALADLRERIGREQVQWGVRYTAGVDGTGADCSEEEDPVDYCDDQADATQLAAHTPGAIPVWHLRGEWKVHGHE